MTEAIPSHCCVKTKVCGLLRGASCLLQVVSRVRSSSSGSSSYQSGAYGASNQRLILPATSQPIPIQPQPPAIANMRSAGGSGGALAPLTPGTTINVQTVGGGMQGFALVPAQYVTQVRAPSSPN